MNYTLVGILRILEKAMINSLIPFSFNECFARKSTFDTTSNIIGMSAKTLEIFTGGKHI